MPNTSVASFYTFTEEKAKWKAFAYEVKGWEPDLEEDEDDDE